VRPTSSIGIDDGQAGEAGGGEAAFASSRDRRCAHDPEELAATSGELGGQRFGPDRRRSARGKSNRSGYPALADAVAAKRGTSIGSAPK